jgi:hypothetical protein
VSVLGTQNSTLAVLSIRLYLPLRNTHPPHCNPILTYTDPTQSSVSIRTTSSRGSTRVSARVSARASVSQFVLQVQAQRLRTPFRPPSLSTLFLVSTSLNHPTLLRHLLRQCSDISVSFYLTSSSPCLLTPFGPPSLSALQSEPLPSNSTWMSARASAWTSVSHSILQVQAHAFGPHSDLCPCLRYECRMDPNCS